MLSVDVRRAEDEDIWLRRLIFSENEIRNGNEIHPEAWERYLQPPLNTRPWSYEISGTSLVLGRSEFLRRADEVVTSINATRKKKKAKYCGLIHQRVEQIRAQGGSFNLDVFIEPEVPADPSHANVVGNQDLKKPDGTVSPETARTLNDIFILVLAGSPEETALLTP